MGECVMSIYGAARMLHSRELGPNQLIPAIKAVGAQAEQCCHSLPLLFDGLPTTGSLGKAIRALEAETRRAGQNVTAVFGRPRNKLRARERLDLERRAGLLGSELQASRELLEVVRAALCPRAVPMTLSGLLHGQWCARPIFVAQRIDLTVPRAASPTFASEPRVLWALLERSVTQVFAAGVEHPYAAVTDDERGQCLRIGSFNGLDSGHLERVTVEVRPTLAIDDEVLDAAAHSCGLGSCATGDPAELCITLS